MQITQIEDILRGERKQKLQSHGNKWQNISID